MSLTSCCIRKDLTKYAKNAYFVFPAQVHGALSPTLCSTSFYSQEDHVTDAEDASSFTLSSEASKRSASSTSFTPSHSQKGRSTDAQGVSSYMHFSETPSRPASFHSEDDHFKDDEKWHRNIDDLFTSLDCPRPDIDFVGAGSFNAVYKVSWKKSPCSGLVENVVALRLNYSAKERLLECGTQKQRATFCAIRSQEIRNETSITLHLGALNQGAKIYRVDATFDNPLQCPYTIMDMLPGSSADNMFSSLTLELKRAAAIAIQDCYQELYRMPVDVCGKFQATDEMPEVGWLPAHDCSETQKMHTIVPFHVCDRPSQIIQPLPLSSQISSMVTDLQNSLKGKNRAVLSGFDECQRQHWWIEKFCKDIGMRTEMRLFHADMASRNVILHVDSNSQVKATIIDFESLCVRPAYATYPDSIKVDCLNVSSSNDSRIPFRKRYAQCLKGTDYQMYEVEPKTCSKIGDSAGLYMLIFHLVNDLLNQLQAPIFTPAAVDECREFFDAWNAYVPIVLQSLFFKRLSDLECDPASDMKLNSESGSYFGSKDEDQCTELYDNENEGNDSHNSWYGDEKQNDL